ncbi:DegT/DnrJ/EryC1/StrS family aminotransferase [Maribacter sp. 2304DJ31-5]|uniref:DegT/DnrJ/EryC1/StrS family aminotransferase n=1 Tax=Maribacter sp. 2304DJ31-5 TaxID=3386273 RepID=UPI0039BD80B9
MGNSEEVFVKKAFKTNWIAPLGPNVSGFENDIQNYIGNDINVAALSSGTGAIHLGLGILGVGKGDEVLCQSFTFSASANPITYLGATPVFIDSELTTWNMSPKLLEEAIVDRIKKYKKPKAIIAVHLYGMPYDVGGINEIAGKYDIPVIEDSAEALGSTYKNQKCGSFGDIAVLSFNGNKIITTSGGGALLSKKSDYVDQAIHLSTQARDDAPHYQHTKIGYNYRMSNVLAGIGRGQMQVLQNRVDARRRNYGYYLENLSSSGEIEFLEEPKGFYSNRWLTCILTPSFEIKERIRLALLRENIESRPLWKPMHMQPIFKDNLNFSDGTSEDLFNRGLCLPSGSNLTKNDLVRVVSNIKNILR